MCPSPPHSATPDPTQLYSKLSTHIAISKYQPDIMMSVFLKARPMPCTMLHNNWGRLLHLYSFLGITLILHYTRGFANMFSDCVCGCLPIHFARGGGG